MNFKSIVIVGLIFAGIIFFFLTRLNLMEDKILDFQKKESKKLEQSFKTLSDSVSAQSEINVVARPGMFDKIFNTAINKEFKEIKKLIPEAIQKEMKNIKFENSTTTINKTDIILKGDSILYLNSDGVITKTAQIIPISKDSSLLLILPQHIELTTVQANPDKDDPSKVHLYVSAYNKTTGDSIRVANSVTYVIPERKSGWKINYKPYIGLNYDIVDGGLKPVAGLNILQYNNKKFSAIIGGIELRQNLKTQNSEIDLRLLQLQLK